MTYLPPMPLLLQLVPKIPLSLSLLLVLYRHDAGPGAFHKGARSGDVGVISRDESIEHVHKPE
jgi:hypothetical protein